MRSFIKMIIVLALIMLVSSCATTKIQIPDKYSLDGQLKRVDNVGDVRVGRLQPAFTTFEESFEDAQTVMARRDTVTFSESKNEWIKVDQQSFILRSGPSDYYLLVLHAPAIGLMTTDSISFQLLSNIIKAGSDFLQLDGINYMIERIYKIEGTQKMLAIKNQIVNQ